MLDVQDFVSGCVLDFVQVLAQCTFAVTRDDKKSPVSSTVLRVMSRHWNCSHNRVSSLASLGRHVVLEEGFAQVPLTGLEKVRISTSTDV